MADILTLPLCASLSIGNEDENLIISRAAHQLDSAANRGCGEWLFAQRLFRR
jgi:hypothetical protein